MSEKKASVLVLLTIVAFLFFVYIGNIFTKDEVYTGTDIRFDTDKTIQIDAPKVTFQAESYGFFALYNENEAIAGVPTEKPLGWTNSQYFSYGPQEITGGNWLFPAGFASINITSDTATTVRLINPQPLAIWLAWLLIACALWSIGYLIVYLVVD